MLKLETIGLAFAILGLLGLGIFASFKARAWFLQPDTTAKTDEDDPVASYRQLLYEGLLDPHEFEHIRARLQTPIVPAPDKPDEKAPRMPGHDTDRTDLDRPDE